MIWRAKSVCKVTSRYSPWESCWKFVWYRRCRTLRTEWPIAHPELCQTIGTSWQGQWCSVQACVWFPFSTECSEDWPHNLSGVLHPRIYIGARLLTSSLDRLTPRIFYMGLAVDRSSQVTTVQVNLSDWSVSLYLTCWPLYFDYYLNSGLKYRAMGFNWVQALFAWR